MKIEHVNIESLIPYAMNSRTHSDDQVAKIAASIKEFGFNNPVLIDDENGTRSDLLRCHNPQMAGLHWEKIHK